MRIIIKFLFGTEKFKQRDQALTLVETKFPRTLFEKLSRKELGKLSTTVLDSKFGKLYNVQNGTSVHFLIDQIQMVETDTLGVFQLYFYKNLFSPSHGHGILNNEKLTKNTIHKLFNEIFSLDKQLNKKKKKEVLILDRNMKFN